MADGTIFEERGLQAVGLITEARQAETILQQDQADMVALPGVGMSILEISHRSKAFEDILHRAVADIRALGNIPDNYKVLLLQGGASTQFSLVPMNLLHAGKSADYTLSVEMRWA